MKIIYIYVCIHNTHICIYITYIYIYVVVYKDYSLLMFPFLFYVIFNLLNLIHIFLSE